MLVKAGQQVPGLTRLHKDCPKEPDGGRPVQSKPYEKVEKLLFECQSAEYLLRELKGE